jgi:hypothetical protein
VATISSRHDISDGWCHAIDSVIDASLRCVPLSFEQRVTQATCLLADEVAVGTAAISLRDVVCTAYLGVIDCGRIVPPQDGVESSLYVVGRSLLFGISLSGPSADRMARDTCLALKQGDHVMAVDGVISLLASPYANSSLAVRFVDQAIAHLLALSNCHLLGSIEREVQWLPKLRTGERMAFPRF